MILNRTVDPTATIVSLADAKDHLRVDDDAQDYYIAGLISAADVAIEEMTGRPVLTQTWAMSMNGANGRVFLPKLPVQSVSSIAYFDRDNASQTAVVSDFYLFKDEGKAWLEPKPNVVWPQTYDREDAITITFVAGYTTIPASLRHAAMMLVAHWYERREAAGDAVQEVPFAVQSLVGLHRVGWVAA